MKAFMDKDFLLNTETARKLYHEFAADCPIIDYHCHLIPREIYEDVQFDNIAQVWLGGDHYKWRLMRCAGVEEKFITGSETSDYEKFCKWAEVLGKSIGNPLYHWSHLELRNFFGYEGALNAKTADEVWNLCNEKLRTKEYSARGLISMSNVETVCTTDNPIDTLEYHQKLAADPSFKTTVLPAWRPDQAIDLEKPIYLDYLAKLEEAAGMKIVSFSDLEKALSLRMDYFAENGCCLSDHGISYIPCVRAERKEIESIFANRLAGQMPSADEIAKFKTECLFFFARQYKQRGWTMQLHYGCQRNNNPRMFAKLGPDTGYDAIDDFTPAAQLSAFLGTLEGENMLPKTIVYSLNPNDNQAIDSILGCFQNDEAVSKLQHGSGWWFNDHFQGMIDQMTSLANLGYLAGFVGMLTDSRSFLSYPRHEYFRRILCRMFGEWVEDGRYPADLELLGEIVQDISYRNAKKYFNFKTK